jgi:hypothetical protein
MDPQSPIRNQRISADWGRAVADGLRASRLDGPGALRSPVGTSLPPPPPAPVPGRPERAPFDVCLTVENGAAALSVKPGRVSRVADGATTQLSYSATDFSTKGAADGYDGEAWVLASPPQGDFTVFAEVSQSSWTLRAATSVEPATGAAAYPVAHCQAADGGGLKIVQLRLGALYVADGGSAAHFGNAEDAEVAETWSVADGTPAILDVTKGAKVLVDTRGNVISWNAGSGEDPETPIDDPSAPAAPPECGNPLNEVVDDNPLDGPGGAGAAPDVENPLDHEGEGGYTPKCSA